jgi:hypothetical protein
MAIDNAAYKVRLNIPEAPDTEWTAWFAVIKREA